MPQLAQYYQVLRKQLKPSVDIQNLGSQQRPIRSSSTFGPQINRINWATNWGHQQVTTLKDAFNKMNQ